MRKTKFQLTDTQNRLALKLARRVEKNRIALLQLPTGFGKTVVTLRALKRLTKKRRRTIVISMPRRANIKPSLYIRPPDPVYIKSNCPWLRDLSKFGKICHPNWDEDYIELVSHKELIDLIFSEKSRNLDNYNDWVAPLIVIDEIHRRPSLIEKIVNANINSQMRYILISATPVNPTQIKEKNRPFMNNRIYQENEDKLIKERFLGLYRSMLKLSSLNKSQKESLDSIDGKISLEDFVDRYLRNAINLIDPIPSAEELTNFKPKSPVNPKLNVAALKENKAVRSLIEYQETANSIFNRRKQSEDEFINRMFLERIAVSGIGTDKQIIAVNEGLEGSDAKFTKKSYHYSSIDHEFKKLSKTFDVTSLDYKLTSVLRFLKSYYNTVSKPGRVLLFCSYLRTAYWLSLWLESKRDIWVPVKYRNHSVSAKLQIDLQRLFNKHGYNRFVWDSESTNKKSGSSDSDISYQFNRPLRETAYRGLLLVTSNRLSESIDLHTNCDVLVHFEMDWSPLRMIQRVGRLWRWNAFKSRRTPEKNAVPKFPNVFHVKYPCSVDEEIYYRLEHRWEKLSMLKLGLDVVPFNLAIGKNFSELREIS